MYVTSLTANGSWQKQDSIMNTTVKGTICGIIAAVSYGMNPLGALFLYEQGINANSVLFYRFTIAATIIGIIMLLTKKSFGVDRKQLGTTCVLGILFGISSVSLFSSFYYMDAGVASTLLFVYPIMVAVIMAAFFHEKVSIATIFSIGLALAGIALLYKGEDGTSLSGIGVMLVMLSSLSYAIYIVLANRSSLGMPALKLTFYVLIFCILTISAFSLFSENGRLQMLTTPSMWGFASILALGPTVISLIMMTLSVKYIGSTPTAIMGALEPLTAVMIGVTIFGETFTARLAIGITMILMAVILIIAAKSVHTPHWHLRLKHGKAK